MGKDVIMLLINSLDVVYAQPIRAGKRAGLPR